MVRTGVFLLVAGPTAAGKTTVLRRLLECASGLVKDVSVTTRAPRPGEQDGRDYRFWSRTAFDAGVAHGEFLEHAVVHGRDGYGTLRGPVLENLARGVDVVKDIDVQGVAQVRRVLPYPRSVAIFLAPPSPEALLARFRGRAADSEEAFARRLASARQELARAGEYDYLVCNETVETAVEDLEAIRRAEHLRREWQEADLKARWQF